MTRALIVILSLHIATMVLLIAITMPEQLFALTAGFSFLHQMARHAL